MSGMSDVEWLVAVEQLKLLQARRVRSLDAQDWDGYRACHAEDFVSHTMGEPIRGIDKTVAGLTRTLAGVQTVHHVHSPEFTFTSPTTATGIWVLYDRLWWTEDGKPHWMVGWGHYHDSYEKRDGRWLFTSRRIERQRIDHSPGTTRYA